MPEQNQKLQQKLASIFPAFELHTNSQKDFALFIHGFTGHTNDMLPVFDFIKNNTDLSCLNVVLQGHNHTHYPASHNDVLNINSVKLETWIEQIHCCIDLLSKHYENIHIIGLSMGALLAIEAFLYNQKAVKALYLLAPAIVPKFLWQTTGLKLLSIIPNQLIPNKIILGYPIKGLKAFLHIQSKIKNQLNKINAHSLLIVHSKDDQTMHYNSSQTIFDHAKSKNKQLVFLENSGHVLTMGSEIDLLLQKIMTKISQTNIE